MPFHICHGLAGQVLDEFIQELGLAHARLPHDPDHVPLALDSPVQQGVENGHLALPTHESAQGTPGPPAQERTRRLQRMDRVDLERLRPSWDGDRSTGFAAYFIMRQLQGVFTTEQHPWRSEMLQQCHEMRHLSHDGWKMRCAGTAADHDRSRVYPQAHLKRYLILSSGVLVGLLQAALQGESGKHCTTGVILQGHRGTK
jgi:hypothetical protein